MNLIPLFINIELDIYSTSDLAALTNNPKTFLRGEINIRLWTAQPEPRTHISKCQLCSEDKELAGLTQDLTPAPACPPTYT